MNKVIFLLLLSLVLLPLHVFPLSPAGAPDGEWAPVDAKDPHIVSLGQYAIEKHDRDSKSGLKFVTVVRGDAKMDSGIYYRLVVTADDVAGPTKNYEAIILVKPWLQTIDLTSFKPVPENRFL